MAVAFLEFTATRIADSSSRNALSISSANNLTLSSLRCASAIHIVRPLESIAETQSQLQWALLRLSAVLLIVVDHFRRRSATADSSCGEFGRFKSATGRTRCGQLGAKARIFKPLVPYIVIQRLVAKLKNLVFSCEKSSPRRCAPGRTRTFDLRIRNPLLYPAELRALYI